MITVSGIGTKLATGKQKALHIGDGADMSLAEARVDFARLKSQRRAAVDLTVEHSMLRRRRPLNHADPSDLTRKLHRPHGYCPARLSAPRYTGCQVGLTTLGGEDWRDIAKQISIANLIQTSANDSIFCAT